MFDGNSPVAKECWIKVTRLSQGKREAVVEAGSWKDDNQTFKVSAVRPDGPETFPLRRRLTARSISAEAGQNRSQQRLGPKQEYRHQEKGWRQRYYSLVLPIGINDKAYKHLQRSYYVYCNRLVNVSNVTISVDLSSPSSSTTMDAPVKSSLAV